MKKLLLLLVATFFLSQMGNAQELQNFDPKNTFGTYLYSFKAIDGTYLSVGCDGNYFYTSRWMGNQITRHNMDGTNPVTFTISGIANIRDFAYDGTHFYAVNQTMHIFKLDLVNQAIVGTISVTCPGVNGLQHVAYDPTLNGGAGGFWTGDVSSLRSVSMSGAQLGDHYYHDEYWFMGSVYDPYTNPETPCVWLMSQVPGGHAIVREYDINSQTMTSYSYNVGNDHPECGGNAGGGMSSYIDKNRKFRIVANVQTSPNINLIYELADLMPSGAPAAVSNAM
ncbi:MAG: hypothetical protein FWD09_08285, partial [Lentimicrobiaceae bacterium]|nr:hypothetical protein [Lentimicrobiaceae bacterium]